MVGELVLYGFHPLKFFDTCFIAQNIAHLDEFQAHLKKNVCSAVVGYNVLVGQVGQLFLLAVLF